MLAQNNVTAMSAAVEENPADITARLALADAVQETGDEVGAVEIRREAEALALRAAILTAKVWLREDQVFTLGTAMAAKGHAARTAERHLGRGDAVQVVIYADAAITKTGLRQVGNGPILYYRQSSGGKWGRSAQTFRVSL